MKLMYLFYKKVRRSFIWKEIHVKYQIGLIELSVYFSIQSMGSFQVL